jgi:phospholipase/carboxylesterase
MFDLKTDLSIKTEINLYYDLLAPENPPEQAPLLVAVHGYGAHKRYMMREAQLVAPESFFIVSLQAPHQHFRKTDAGYKVGFGWLTDYKSDESVRLHHDFVNRVVEKLVENFSVDEKKVFLFGFSQACALNFRYALTYPERVRGVIGICGGIPSDLETSALYKTLTADVFYLYSDADEFYPLEKYLDFAERLKHRAPHLEAKKYAAAHEITDEMRRDVKNWLEEKTKAEN